MTTGLPYSIMHYCRFKCEIDPLLSIHSCTKKFPSVQVKSPASRSLSIIDLQSQFSFSFAGCTFFSFLFFLRYTRSKFFYFFTRWTFINFFLFFHNISRLIIFAGVQSQKRGKHTTFTPFCVLLPAIISWPDWTQLYGKSL